MLPLKNLARKELNHGHDVLKENNGMAKLSAECIPQGLPLI